MATPAPPDPPRSQSPDVPADAEIVSLFKRIAAADPRSVERKQREHPHSYRLASQFDPEIIEVILKYARGRYSKCYRGRCRKRIHMTDKLRKFTACAVCRAKAAVHSKDARDKERKKKAKRKGERGNVQVRIRFTHTG